jgi:uncharacterized protein YybS (DUF2232 family)
MDFPDKGTLLDVIKGSVATLVLFLAYVSLPLIGILPGLFAPLPAMYFTLKSGRGAGIAVVLITLAVLAFIADPTALLLYLVQSGVISLAVPVFLAKGWGAARAVAYSVAISLACLLLFVATAWFVRGINLHGEILKGINTSIAQTALLYEKSGLKGEELQTLQEGMRQAGVLIGRIYPALVLVGLAAIAGFNLLALGKLAARRNQPFPVGDFRKFRNPDHLIWFVIVAGFAMLLKNADVAMAALNVLVVTLSLYFLQGLAITACWFDRFAAPRLVRVILYTVLALQPYLAIAVAVLGIFDLWGNFRTPKHHENL